MTWELLKISLTKKFKEIAAFLTSIIKRGIAEYLEALLPIAMSIVTNIGNTYAQADGETKRKMAVAELQKQAIQIGISVGTSVLNLAVEMAVQKLKAQRN